jgi:hypothetical protein
MKPGDPGHALTQPGPPEHPARVILNLHIMVIFRPVITSEQHCHLPHPAPTSAAARRRTPAA